MNERQVQIGRLYFVLTLLYFGVMSFSHTSLSAQTPPVRVIHLLSPAGGESLSPGDTIAIGFEIEHHFIRSGDILDTFAIEFSDNGGEDWSELFISDRDFTERSTSVKWVVPDVSSSDCRLRIIQRAGRWGLGRVVSQRSIPITRDSLFESVIRPSDSVMVINAMDRLHIVDPWNPERPVRTIVWHYPLVRSRLINVRFEQNDSLMVVGSVPVGLGGTEGSTNGEYGILDFYSGKPLKMFQTRFRRSSGPPQLWMTRGGFTIDLTHDGTRMLRTHADNTDIISVESETPLFEVSSIAMKHGSCSQFSPDERYFVIGSQTALSVWSTESLDTIWAHIGADADQVQYSHDGRYLLVTPGFREQAFQEWQGPGDYTGESNRILYAATGDTVLTRPISTWRPDRGWYREEVHGAFASLSNVYTFQNRVYSSIENPAPRFFETSGAGSIAIAPGGGYYCLAMPDGTLTIYDMGYSSQPGDTNDLSFAIASQTPIVANINLPRVIVGESTDTLVTSFIINPGPGTLSVSDVSITSGNQQDFIILAGSGPLNLAPGERSDLRVRFAPTDTGARSATVSIATSSGDVEVEMRGFGLHPDPRVSVREDVRGDNESGVRVTPNPAQGLITVSVAVPQESLVTATLYDVTGRTVQSINLRLSAGENLFWLDVSDVPAGVYRILISGAHRRETAQLVILQ